MFCSLVVTAIVYFLAYDVIMNFPVLLFVGLQFFIGSHTYSGALSNLSSPQINTEKSEIVITLITPDVSAGVEIGEVDLEGLVNDLSVKEVKLLINAQEVQFVPVNKGYFSKKVYLSQRYNDVTVYGSNLRRQNFRYEYKIVNHSKREKSADELLPPKIELNYLQEDLFKVLSPSEFDNLQIEISDNKDEVVQLAYIINDEPPVYLPRKKRFVRLDIERSRAFRSIKLLVYAIDGDGNKVSKKYHFRMEDLACRLNVSPEYGIYSETPVLFNSTVKGGVGEIKKIYTLVDKSGKPVVHETLSSMATVYLDGRKIKDDYKASLKIIDQNGIEATCSSQTILKFYPKNHLKSFGILPQTSLKSTRQKLYFSIEPPVRKGEIAILLKEQDSSKSYLGEDWKMLGRKVFESKNLQRFWEVELRRRVPVGKYQMKLSVVSDSSEITFTEKILVEVTKSKDDKEDLLQEILRGE